MIGEYYCCVAVITGSCVQFEERCQVMMEDKDKVAVLSQHLVVDILSLLFSTVSRR